MATMTKQQLMYGITSALREAYPNANIYNKRTLQSVNDGDFNVIPVSFRLPEKLMHWYGQSATFDIVYYCDDENEDPLDVVDTLGEILQTITTPSGAILHPSDMDFTRSESALHCVITYNYHTLTRWVEYDEHGQEVTDTELMQELTQTIEPEGEDDE